MPTPSAILAEAGRPARARHPLRRVGRRLRRQPRGGAAARLRLATRRHPGLVLGRRSARRGARHRHATATRRCSSRSVWTSRASRPTRPRGPCRHSPPPPPGRRPSTESRCPTTASSARRASTPGARASGTARSAWPLRGPAARWAWPTRVLGRPIRRHPSARPCRRGARRDLDVARRPDGGRSRDRRRPRGPRRRRDRPGADRAPRRRADRDDDHRPMRSSARTRPPWPSTRPTPDGWPTCRSTCASTTASTTSRSSVSRCCPR